MTRYSDKSGYGQGEASPSHQTLALAWLAETWERLWPLLVPAFMLLCAFAALSWVGVWSLLGPVLRYAALGLLAAGLLVSLMPLRHFSLPNRPALLRRIERESGLQHRPASTQPERAVSADSPFARALWREHKRRMAAQLSDLRTGPPRPRAARYDRWALRAMLPLLAFAAWGYSHSAGGGRIGDILREPVDTAAILSRLDIWATPPAYTGKPPVYLSRTAIVNPAGATPNGETSGIHNEISLPEGSELVIRHVGKEQLTARLLPQAENAEAGEQQIVEGTAGATGETMFTARLDESIRAELRSGDTLVAGWNFAIIPDQPPSIEFSEQPGGSLAGSLELAYEVEDDHGVVSARALIESAEPALDGARPLYEAPEVLLPLPRARARTGLSRVNRDLSSHPWAGSRISITLEASDDPGQKGYSKPVTMILPGRSFNDPLAKALVEQRRIVALDANRARRAADLLDAVTARPDTFPVPAGIYVSLRAAYRMLAAARSDDSLREAADLLWEAALAIELGDLSDAERRLREAQENLSKALEEGADDAEIDRLMQELRQAMNDFLEQLQREMAQNPIDNAPMQLPENQQMLTQRDLERMMDRIEDLARSGSQDAARQLLSELQRMMDNLQAGRHQQQRQQEGNQLNQTLDQLSELMQRQQELMDETFDMRRRAPDGQQPPEGPRQGENSPRGDQMTPEEFAEALENLRQRQQALQEQLEQLGEELGRLGLDPSSEFGEAGEEMGEAGENLGEGDAGAAASDQGQALEALRRGAQSMMQQLAGDRGGGGQQQGQAGPGGQDQDRFDPLGRSTGANGRFNDENTRVPSEIDAQRAREILEAIRKRLSDPLRPLLERNYLERLLESR